MVIFFGVGVLIIGNLVMFLKYCVVISSGLCRNFVFCW